MFQRGKKNTINCVIAGGAALACSLLGACGEGPVEIPEHTQFAGSGGCNRYFGSLTIGADEFRPQEMNGRRALS